MCGRYCGDPRTIILCVVPGNADMTTSDGLHMARELDPKGLRTLGVITKIDIAPVNVFEETRSTLVKILKSPGCQRMPVVVKPEDDISIFAQNLASDKVCPIFAISNVTGEGIPKLKEFLSMLNSRILISGLFKKPSEPVEFLIDGIY